MKERFQIFFKGMRRLLEKQRDNAMPLNSSQQSTVTAPKTGTPGKKWLLMLETGTYVGEGCPPEAVSFTWSVQPALGNATKELSFLPPIPAHFPQE
jgi:hypothetical protein